MLQTFSDRICYEYYYQTGIIGIDNQNLSMIIIYSLYIVGVELEAWCGTKRERDSFADKYIPVLKTQQLG